MVLSEETLKVKYRKEPFTVFEIEEGTVLTPSAKQFILDKNIEIVIKNKNNFSNQEKQENSVNFKDEEEINFQDKVKFVGKNGEYYFEKPEHMTRLEGNILVPKCDRTIMFRAKLEVYLSEVLLLTKELDMQFSNEKLSRDMDSICKFVDAIMVAEALDQILENQILLEGKYIKDIKDIVHNPKNYFKKGHIFEISTKNSILIHKLNRLRCISRELETYGVEYFLGRDGVKRKDLLEAFNVLSSTIYIMMLKAENGEYGNI